LLGVEFNSFVRDYVNYPNINDLMKISDILISDYSATIFDYAILERPIISFAYDCDEYGEERGFAMDPRAEMPGGIVKTEDEVIDRILGMNYEKEVAAVKAFKNKYLTYGGQATEKCVKKMFEV
jgi:CDP-glycerol glycerophosphotransferase